MATVTGAGEWCDTDPAAVSAERAHTLIKASVRPVVEVETVALRDALGRVTAADIVATAPVPNHTNSAMDGYALHAGDLAGDGAKLTVVGVALAGKPFTGAVGDGEAVRIMTGAVLPDGADAVVIQEHAVADGGTVTATAGDTVTVTTTVTVGDNIRHAGEDLAAGDTAIPAGVRIAPAHLGLAASLGVAELPVRRRPRVAFFSNGDELRELGAPLAVGELYDSNRHTLHGMLTELGVDIVDLGVVADDAAAVAAALRAAAAADAVITTAGASVGDADFIRAAAADLGELAFNKVAIKPGRPFAFGRVGRGVGGDGGDGDDGVGGDGDGGDGDDGTAADGALLFALPGNPVSVMVTFQIFVAPALRQLAGETGFAPLRLCAVTATALKKRKGRAEYQRGVLTVGDGHGAADGAGDDGDGVAAVVHTTGEQGSGILRSMGDANCFIILPTDSAGTAEGDTVTVQPFFN